MVIAFYVLPASSKLLGTSVRDILIKGKTDILEIFGYLRKKKTSNNNI